MFLNKDIEIMETKIVIYEDANGEIKLDVSLENDTLWLSQKQLEVPILYHHHKNPKYQIRFPTRLQTSYPQKLWITLGTTKRAEAAEPEKTGA